MNQDYEKLEALLLSPNPANLALAVELAQSQDEKRILDLYKQMQEVHAFWKAVPLKNYPSELSDMINYFEQEGINFFKNYSVKEIPSRHDILIPFIKSFYTWYTSFHTLPKGIGQFTNIEEIEIASGPINSIRKELWQLPKLKKLKLSIAKNIVWTNDISYAQNLESLELLGTVHPALPSALPTLKKLRRLRIYAMGSPKDARQLEALLWDCQQLEILELFGKTILLPESNHVKQLKKLQELEINRTNWIELPEALTTLKKLRKLRLSKLIKLKKLPNWFSELPLETLEIYACKFNNAFDILQKIPTLKSLKISKNIQKKITPDDWKTAFEGIDLEII